MHPLLVRLAKEIQFRSPLRRYFFPRLAFQMTIPQLCYLCECVAKTRNVPGSIVEVGCFVGTTTLFLNKYMDDMGIEKRYYALDSFSGFTSDDVHYEVAERGQAAKSYTGFQVNSKVWFDYTMRLNHTSRVQSIQADANTFDFSQLGPISFSLLDVDLYRPIKHCLPILFEVLAPGGIMIVDDCHDQTAFNGAYQAYREFCQEIGAFQQVECGKLGVLHK